MLLAVANVGGPVWVLGAVSGGPPVAASLAFVLLLAWVVLVGVRRPPVGVFSIGALLVALGAFVGGRVLLHAASFLGAMLVPVGLGSNELQVVFSAQATGYLASSAVETVGLAGAGIALWSAQRTSG